MKWNDSYDLDTFVLWGRENNDEGPFSCEMCFYYCSQIVHGNTMSSTHFQIKSSIFAEVFTFISSEVGVVDKQFFSWIGHPSIWKKGTIHA